MKAKVLVIVALSFIILTSCSQIEYPGRKVPGDKPEKFAPETISKDGYFAFAPAFTPDGKELFYTVRKSNSDENRIFYMKYEGGKWSEPALAPFAKDIYEMTPSLSPDGETLVFASERPAKGKQGINLWMTKKQDGKWSDPVCLQSPFNKQFNINVSIVNDGSYYLTSVGGIHKSENIKGKFSNPAILSDAINSFDQADNAYVAPDETYIIFNAQNRVEYKRRADLFIAFKKDGEWTRAIKMDENINSKETQQMAPYVSPDGKYLFFTRFNGEQGDIYWVNAPEVIEKHKQMAIK